MGDGTLASALSGAKNKDDVDMDVDALRKIACDTLTQASTDGSLAQALSLAKGREDVVVGQTPASSSTAISPVKQTTAPVSEKIAVARKALLDAETTVSGAAQEVYAEMEQLRNLATAEFDELREEARVAQADIKATYDEVRNELHDLREQTQGANKEFQELKEAARQVRELLNMKPS